MSRAAIRFYDTFAALYPVLDLFLRAPKRKLVERVNAEPAGRLLEIGVGRGDTLCGYTHASLTGIDASEGMLAFARKCAPDGCVLRVMDAENLEFPDAAFDYAVISSVLSVVERPGRVMDEIHRILVPGGRAFILNHHVSSGTWRHRLNLMLAPLTKMLHFSAIFDVQSHVDPAKFTLRERKGHGLMPRQTLFVLEKI